MSQYGPGIVAVQVSNRRDGLAKTDGLAFRDAMDSAAIEDAAAKHCPNSRDRIFSPLVTLFAFTSQAMSADHSCREAVARVNADRIAIGLDPASADTGAYCAARLRLPEALIKDLAKLQGKTLEDKVPDTWRWKDRDVKVGDGATFTMADTSANQDEFPQTSTQGDGIGFPISRIVFIFSLVTGAILDLAFGAYKGKETGEHALLREMLSAFKRGDVFLADAYYSSYFLIAGLVQLGVDVVFHADGRRPKDFRSGQRLGHYDHLLTWKKPVRPDWMSEEAYASMPDTIVVRQCRVLVNIPGFRTRSITIVTTMTDPKIVARLELGDLYRRRWLAELFVRAMKETLQMDHLRCKTPEMVAKEVWVHALAYNIIRKIMAQAAHRKGLRPLQVSFKGVIQTITSYRCLFVVPSGLDKVKVMEHLLDAVAEHIVGDRPNRFEPRAVKRRPKPYPRLMVRRGLARARLVRRG